MRGTPSILCNIVQIDIINLSTTVLIKEDTVMFKFFKRSKGSLLALSCMSLLLTSCGSGTTPKAVEIVDKTFTFTGEGQFVGWDTKYEIFSDDLSRLENGKEYTLEEIFTTYLDSITLGEFGPDNKPVLETFETIGDLKKLIDENLSEAYSRLTDIKVAVSDEQTKKVTITYPESFSDLYQPTLTYDCTFSGTTKSSVNYSFPSMPEDLENSNPQDGRFFLQVLNEVYSLNSFALPGSYIDGTLETLSDFTSPLNRLQIFDATTNHSAGYTLVNPVVVFE